MKDLLLSSSAKLRRAIELRDEVLTELSAFARDANIGFEIADDGDSKSFTIRLKIKKQPQFLRWSMVVADALQNMRASLDHALYAIAVSRSGKDPPPSEGNLQFPICTDDTAFEKALWRLGELKNDDEVVKVVGNLQPYNRPGGFYLPALHLLRDFNNRDKHKTLNMTLAATRAMTFPLKLPEGITVTGGVTALETDLADGCFLQQVGLSQPVPGLEVDHEHVSLAFEAVIHEFVHVRPRSGLRNQIEVYILLDYLLDEVSFCHEQLAALIGVTPPDSQQSG